MIQRIQSLYLLGIIILGTLLFFVPVIQLNTAPDAAVQRMFEISATGMDEITPDMEHLYVDSLTLNGLWGLTLTTLLIPFMAFVDLFLYRRRILQARLNIFLAMLCLGYYGILYMYIWFAKMNFGLDWHICFWACIPLICFVLTLGATRRILKDEALVRAADRIR